MAAMGKRGITGGKTSTKPPEVPSGSPALMTMNLVISPVQIQPVATLGFTPSPLGVPIMREDFITETGFLPSSPQD
jgi:hypothetical protein